jgi:hypothetical protein
MKLRLGVDLDGTLADLSSAYHELERRLVGEQTARESDAAEIEEGEKEQAADGQSGLKAARHKARQRDRIWQVIRETEDFWLGLAPLEPGGVRRRHHRSIARGWEVFFITQRPSTVGQTVQRQTQQWLAREGFDMPSVLTLAGARGKVAKALELNVLLDDYRKNCVDVLSESHNRCRPILVQRTASAAEESVARGLGIGVVHSVAEALDHLETPSTLSHPSAMRRVLERLGLASVEIQK